MWAIIGGLAVARAHAARAVRDSNGGWEEEVLRGLEVVDGLAGSCRQLRGDDDVRNTRKRRPCGRLSCEMRFGWVFGTISATGCSSRHEAKDTHPPALQSLVVQPSDRLSEFCIQVSDSRRSTVRRSAGPPPHLVAVTTCADIGASFSSHGASAAVTASRARSTADESRRSISARKGEPSTRPRSMYSGGSSGNSAATAVPAACGTGLRSSR